MHHETLLDQPVFRELQDTAGAEFVAELIGTFAEEAQGMLADLQRSHGAGDADNFRRAAHSLKSNALSFGAVQLAEQARALELGGLAAASVDSLAQLRATCEASLAALKALAHG